jgi:hypothetical protein
MRKPTTLWKIVAPKRTLLRLLLATLPVAFSASAHAAESSYHYEFEAEFLDGDQLEGNALQIVARPDYGYIPLIKPRTSYVRELLKSVETL